MAPRRASLSETELEVLKALWEAGKATVRELNERLSSTGRKWAYTTVLTFLMRLETKGYVATEKKDGVLVFHPLVSRDLLLKQKLLDLADDLCDGTATPLVHALCKGTRFTPEDIQQFRRLLDTLEQEPAPRKKSPPPKRKR